MNDVAIMEILIRFEHFTDDFYLFLEGPRSVSKFTVFGHISQIGGAFVEQECKCLLVGIETVRKTIHQLHNCVGSS